MSEVQGQAPQAQPLPDSMNPHEAAALLSQFIQDAEKVQTSQPRDETGKFAKQPEAPVEAAAPPVEEAPKAEAEEPKPEEQEAEIQPEPRRFKLKYKGEEMEKDEPEVIELAQKGFDYTQKSQQLAKERDEISAKTKAEVEANRNSYLQQLEIHRQAITKLSGVKTMAEIEQLSRTDPAGAQQEFLRAVAVNQQLQAIEAEQAKVQRQMQEEARESFSKKARESVDKLQDRIPGWSNDLYAKILKSGVANGFTQEEVNAITDHRAIEVLNKARQWDEYVAAKPKASEKKVPPVAPKVQKPGAGEVAPKANKVQDSMANLNKSGSRSDAEEYVRALAQAGRI